MTTQPHPQYIHGSPEIDHFQTGAVAHNRTAAIGPYCKAGANLHRACRRIGSHANDLAILLNEIGRFGLHLYLESWVTFCLFNDEVEKIPLRHEGEKLAASWKMREVGHLDCFVPNLASKFTHLLMRALKELLQNS